MAAKRASKAETKTTKRSQGRATGAKKGGAAKPKKAAPRRTSGKAARLEKEQAPTAEQLAAFVGVPLRAGLSAQAAQKLLKPYPGFRAIMDNVADNLRRHNSTLELRFDPDEVMATLARANDLSSRNALLEKVLAGSDAERQELDGQLMRVLVDAVRRVREESSAHPELEGEWRAILDFVAQFRPGRGPSNGTAPG